MEKVNVGELVVRLLESKCKTYSQTTIKVWVEELKDINENILPIAIKRMILSDDDFPTVGKVLTAIDDTYEYLAREMIVSDNEEVKELSKKANFDIDKYRGGIYGVESMNKCVKRLAGVLKENFPKSLLSSNKLLLTAYK